MTRHGTRRLAAALASVLLGLCLALGLPIALPFQSFLGIGLFSFAGALVPVLVGALRRRPGKGHSCGSLPVRFRAPGELVCLRREYAMTLGTSLGVEALPVARRRSRLTPEVVVAAVIAAGVAPFAYAVHHPQVRVLNLGDAPIRVLVDGHELGTVEPSSGESPAAGALLRVPAGPRSLTSVDLDRKLVSRDAVEVTAGLRHLYVPGSVPACFWLESVGYGKGQRDRSVSMLQGETRFWPIPEEVTGWFVEPPPPAQGARATGGTTTVLRQGRCE